jgi:hypothetical protein
MRLIRFLFLATLLALPALPGRAAEPVNVRAMLVIASSQRGESDARLAAYEPTLRRVLRFDNYRLAGSGSASLSPTGTTTMNLGREHALLLDVEKSEGRNVRFKVRWTEGGRSLINTGLSLQPGQPAVLGGPSTGKEGEVWAVILVAN